VDVAIVGAGVTGAATAWMFARSGVRVAVLEAAHVGEGSTSASTALLMQEPDNDFRQLAWRYGTPRARRIWQLSSEATRTFVRTLEALHVRCGLSHHDSVYYALGANAAEGLRDELRRRHHAGLSGRWLDAMPLRRLTGIDGAGAIRTTGNAQVDPYRACTGLLRAAGARGARIYERSAVDRIETDRRGATLFANGAAIRCTRIVIATGFATPFLEPLAARFRMLLTYVVATQRIPLRVRREIGLSEVMLWDTARPYHYGRWTADGRLMLGGGDASPVPERRRAAVLQDRAMGVWRYFGRRYPALQHVDVDCAWEGLFATTPDGLPYIGAHRDYPRHLFALGYGGNGMTFGFLAARLLLDAYRGRRSGDHALFAFDRLG
jgi:glycine/D-amino acid oxidase-like deaminating enzyme